MENKNNEKTTITGTQVSMIYDTLKTKAENTNEDKLKAAKEQTNNTEYKESTITDSNFIGMPQITPDKEAAIDNLASVIEQESDYKEALKEYNISDDDTKKLFEIIMEYKKSNSFEGLYDKLPDNIKTLANGFRNINNVRISKDNAAKILIDSFINDAKLNKALDEFNEEMSNAFAGTAEEYKNIMNEYIENLYKDIDKIEVEDPEKAQTLKNIKKAFEDANKFTKELEYVNHTSAKKLKKALKSYDSECFYFNRKVNTTDITLPDIRSLLPIIKRALPDRTERHIKEFIIVICKASYSYNYNNIDELAYTYRSIENILAFRAIYMADFESDFAKEVFGGVSAVITKIIELEEA